MDNDKTITEYTLRIDEEFLNGFLSEDSERWDRYENGHDFRVKEDAEKYKEKAIRREISIWDWEDGKKPSIDEIRSAFTIEENTYPISVEEYKRLECVINLPFHFSVNQKSSMTNFVRLYDQFVKYLNTSDWDEGRIGFFREMLVHAMEQSFNKFAKNTADRVGNPRRAGKDYSEKEARVINELADNTYINWATESRDGGKVTMTIKSLDDHKNTFYDRKDGCKCFCNFNSTSVEPPENVEHTRSVEEVEAEMERLIEFVTSDDDNHKLTKEQLMSWRGQDGGW
jgi:hypothetical protein